MRQVKRKRAAKAARIIAYDFETTRIEAGTPRPLYLTAFGLDPEFSIETPLRDLEHLRDVLIRDFLIPEFDGVKFCAWNANNFDAYFVAAALLTSTEFVMRPYLTKNNSLRGLRVIPAEDADKPLASQRGWEFLDGMAMLGLATVSLEKFLANFAPDTQKLKGTIDFERETFDAMNPAHRAYAMRDSEGLYYGMIRAQGILLEHFNQGLTATIGNACIKIFKSHIPADVKVDALPDGVEALTREYVMRGGYCYCVRRYAGPVWKYDINQAYAAAMREAKLPADKPMHSAGRINQFAQCFIVRITATNPNNRIPFYYRATVNGRIKSVFGTAEITDTWITSIEHAQLQREGWRIRVIESWCWAGWFNMREFVDRLEVLRMTCEGGPSGPTGTMVKAVGNHSYGKTVSQSPGETFLLAKDRPPGYAPYYGDDMAPVEHVWFTFEEEQAKDYEQPHIGAFITAHVRMVVRRAALIRPGDWLYADTDCVVFSSDVTALLDTDAKRYGAWKIEEEGTQYRIIAKKVYQNVATGKGNAKGLSVRKLKPADFEAWFEGSPPEQEQTQRNNFVKVMASLDMYRTQKRKGTSVEINRTA